MIAPNIQEIEARIKTDPNNPLHHIALAKAYLEEGREDKARTVIVTKRRLPRKDASIHYEWGKLCEELGMARQARESYEQAVALRPQDPQYHFRIALLCHESGAWERALKHLQKTVALSPQHEEARKMLATLYREMGLRGAADVVEKKEAAIDACPQTIPFQLSEEDAGLLLDLFNGRGLGYAEYQIVSTGNEAYVYYKNSLGLREISDHLKGERTIGVYLLRGDRTLKCCGVEVRIPWRKLVASIKDAGFLAIAEDKIHSYAREIKSKAKELGFPAYLEDSGDRGRRVWFFFEDFIPYEMAERFLNSLIDRVFSPGIDLSIGLMLGFKPSGVGKKDEPVMLPLGVKRWTGKKSSFIDDDGNRYNDQLLFLKKVRRVSRDEIQRFFKGPEREHQSIDVSSSNLFVKLQRRCPVVESIVLKAKSGRNLQIEEKMILYFTVGFLPGATQILHDVLETCPDYRPNRVNRMISRLGKNPVSCPKIRELMPETTAYLPCRCSFDLQKGLYPTPLLHIDPALVQRHSTEGSPPSPLEEIEIRYASIVRRIEELNREKTKLEEKLRELRSSKSGLNPQG
jgi:hypothetical protein